MNNRKTLLLLFLLPKIVCGQQVFCEDELGSPIREVHLVNTQSTIHTYTDKEGVADLSSFLNTDLIIFSRSGFKTVSYYKNQLLRMPQPITLMFDSETIGEVILLTRIDDENLKTTAERRVVLHTKEIERLNTQTTADLLEKRAGVNVQKSQMGGGSPVIRGFEANRILLMVDGVRLNNAIYRGGHLQNIISVDNAALERVDIIFGPSSSIFGSDALGGVIHLQTKRPKFTPTNRMDHNYSTRYASVNRGISRHYDITYTGKSFALFTSFSNNNFGDLRMGKNRAHGFEDWGKVYTYVEDGEELINENVNIQKNTAYTQIDMMQKVILDLAPNWDFTGNFQISKSSEIPRFDRLDSYETVYFDQYNEQTIYEDLKYATWNYGPQKRTLSSFQFDHSSQSSFVDSAQIIFAYQDIEESRQVERMNSGEYFNRIEKVDVYSCNINLRKNKILYGLEYFHNDVLSNAFKTSNNRTSPSAQTRYPNGGALMSSIAGYFTYSKSFNERFTFHSGLRQTLNQLKAQFYSIPGEWELPFDQISYNYQALTGNISLAFHPNDSWKIGGIVSTGFHPPNIDDTGKLFTKGDILTIPNFNLRPEHTITGEFNITKNVKNLLLINANIYYTHINDAIMRSETNLQWEINPEESFTDIRTNENVGEAIVYGGTFSLSARFGSNYTLESDYTLIKGKNTTQNTPFTHIPPSFGKTALYADFENWRASFFILFNGRKSINEYDIISGTDNEEESPIVWTQTDEGNYIIEYQGTPSWNTINMSLMYRVSNQFTVQVSLENIFDKHYKTFASGISAPGRNLILTLRTRF